MGWSREWLYWRDVLGAFSSVRYRHCRSLSCTINRAVLITAMVFFLRIRVNVRSPIVYVFFWYLPDVCPITFENFTLLCMLPGVMCSAVLHYWFIFHNWVQRNIACMSGVLSVLAMLLTLFLLSLICLGSWTASGEAQEQGSGQHRHRQRFLRWAVSGRRRPS